MVKKFCLILLLITFFNFLHAGVLDDVTKELDEIEREFWTITTLDRMSERHREFSQKLALFTISCRDIQAKVQETKQRFHLPNITDSSVAIEDITFDNSVYLITLEVKDNGKGNLVAEKPVIVKKGVQGNLEEISFKNVYTHSIPDSDTNIPQTSDNRNLALWIAFLFVSSLGFVTVNLKTKKSRQDDK